MRTDLVIMNERKLKLQCSHFEPTPEQRILPQLPCVIYLHGNASSRYEAISLVKYLLPNNITLFCFDFSGSGHSDGEYISLGWFEKEDVKNVVEYLRKTNTVSTIGLWGRSMGAVTSLLHGDRDPSIAGIICDSAFTKLKKLALELAKTRVSLPGFVLSAALSFVEGTIKSKANFSIYDLNPIEHVDKSFIPIQFVCAKNDVFILPKHTKKLYEKYAGDKALIEVEGDHNSARPKYAMDSMSIFLYNTLQVEAMIPHEMIVEHEKKIHSLNLLPPSIPGVYDLDNQMIQDVFGFNNLNSMSNQMTEEELIKIAIEESLKSFNLEKDKNKNEESKYNEPIEDLKENKNEKESKQSDINAITNGINSLYLKNLPEEKKSAKK